MMMSFILLNVKQGSIFGHLPIDPNRLLKNKIE